MNLRNILLFLLPICTTPKCQLQIRYWIITIQHHHLRPNSLIIPHNYMVFLLITQNHPTSVSYIFINSNKKYDQTNKTAKLKIMSLQFRLIFHIYSELCISEFSENLKFLILPLSLKIFYKAVQFFLLIKFFFEAKEYKRSN